jgi:diadenosine tetraphosphate (Ap4A) HIT family hydrolase
MVSHPARGRHHQQGGSRVGSARDGNSVVLKDGRATFQSVFHFDLHVVQRENGDKLSFAKGMLLRHDPDREKTGRTLREALEKIDATE